MIVIKECRTTYILLAGLPGTGKSTIATELAASLHPSVILDKDKVRAALFPGEATDYSDTQNDICMQAMLAAAACLSAQPHPPSYIFFDGRTFSRTVHIDQVVHSAEANNAAWRILHVWCEDAIAVSRLAEGSANHPAKNRDAALYASLKQSFEPIRRPHFSVDTGQILQHCVDACLAYLKSKGP